MVLDVLFLVVVVAGMAHGLRQGVVRTVSLILSMTLGIMMGFKFGPAMAKFLEVSTGSQHPVLFVLGFILSLVCSYYLFRWAGKVLEGAFRTVRVNFANQLVGGIFLTLIYLIFFSFFIRFLRDAAIVQDQALQESRAYDLILEDMPEHTATVFSVISPTIRDFWNKSSAAMDKMKEVSIERSGKYKEQETPTHPEEKPVYEEDINQ